MKYQDLLVQEILVHPNQSILIDSILLRVELKKSFLNLFSQAQILKEIQGYK